MHFYVLILIGNEYIKISVTGLKSALDELCYPHVFGITHSRIKDNQNMLHMEQVLIIKVKGPRSR